jgi:hypothetical protein
MSIHHSSIRRDILSALKQANATLIRTGKHEIWKLPNGNIITVSVTPRDRRALFNVRSDIRRGMNSHGK